MLRQFEVQNIYVWEFKEWKPWANTFMYLPMKDDFNDATWNNTITNSWATITTVDWVTCWYFNYNTLTWSVTPSTSTNKTFSVWIRPDSWNSWWIIWSNHSGYYSWDYFMYNSSSIGYECYYAYWDTSYIRTSTSLSQDTWQHLCYANWKIYLNWTELATSTSWTMNMASWYPYTIWSQNSSANAFRWYMSEFIVETVWWTSQEVLDYYNQTKANYWL